MIAKYKLFDFDLFEVDSRLQPSPLKYDFSTFSLYSVEIVIISVAVYQY